MEYPLFDTDFKGRGMNGKGMDAKEFFYSSPAVHSFAFFIIPLCRL